MPAEVLVSILVQVVGADNVIQPLLKHRAEQLQLFRVLVRIHIRGADEISDSRSDQVAPALPPKSV